MTGRDIREFNGYLRACTDNQVQGCYEKERKAGREDYMALVEAEAERRGLILY